MELFHVLSYTLPVKFPVAFFRAGLHPFNDGLPHTGNRHQVEGLIDGVPVLLREKYCIVPFPGNNNRFVSLRCFVNQVI